ncbi:MAG: T9SS type A sorting domain-containing protein [bacterium]
MKYLFTIIILTITTLIAVQSETAIYSKDYPKSKVVNFGPCFLGDSVHSSIVLVYDGTESVYINNGEPTLKVFYSPHDKSLLENQFRNFDPDMKRVQLPRTLNSLQPKLELPFYFYADINVALWPLGVYHARAMLALAKSSNNDVVIADTFTLKAKKTDLYIDGFTDSLNFDSVYVNPVTPKELVWLVKSTKMPKVEVTNQKIEIESPYIDDEFFIVDFEKKPVFNQKYQTIPWNIRYVPHNQGKDSGLVRVYYAPNKEQFPDSTRFAKVKLYGVGVEQKLALIESNYSIIGDTIDIGYVVTGSKTFVTGNFENQGNVPIAALSEVCYKVESDDNAVVNTLSKKAFIVKALPIGEKTQFQINCEPKENGIFLERYIINTNIKERNIHGVPAEAVSKTIYIRGIGASPKLRLPFDTLDFGSVVINDLNCPSKKDTSITITNVGTSILIIKNITVIPNEKFLIGEQSFEIQPNTSKVLNLSFFADDGEFGPFSAKLEFVTNMMTPAGSIELMVNRIPKEKSWLNIPKNIKAQPGRLISIPIILEDKDYGKHPIRNAKNFQTVISYDSTIMRYDNRELIGTASEGADVNISQLTSGSIEININNKADYFKVVDTLINLQFRTYLGEVLTTELAFTKSKTKFGDGLCDDVLNIDGNIENGIFSLDSVCGLQYKTKVIPRGITIQSISPNPASDAIDLEFFLPKDSQCKIEIYDSKGQLVTILAKEKFTAGLNKHTYDISSFLTGIYFIKISSMDGAVEKSLLISK